MKNPHYSGNVGIINLVVSLHLIGLYMQCLPQGGVEADCPQFESGGNIFQVTGKTLTLAMRGMPPPIRGGGGMEGPVYL